MVNKAPTSHQGQPIPGGPINGTTFSAYTNVDQEVTSFGAGVGAAYKLNRNFDFFANYSYATFSLDDETFEAGFNTPENRFNVGVNAKNLVDRFGFGLSYRWQQEFLYESSFGTGIVPSFGVLDGQVSVKIPEIKSTIKIGMNNILGDNYITNVGNPTIGSIFYAQITYDDFLH